MGKKTRDSDIVADFFGDGDVDWLNDDADEAPPAPARSDEASVAASPAVPATPPARVAFEAAPSLGNAPTLVFSAVPTLPPIVENSTEETAVASPPAAAVEAEAPVSPVEAQPEAPPALVPETASIAAESVAWAAPEEEVEVVAVPLVPLPPSATPPGAQPRIKRTRQISDPPEESMGHVLDGESPPLVRTIDPAPARARLPVGQDPRVMPRVPAPVERPVPRAWDVGDDLANWRNTAQILVTEAALAEPDVRARWLAAAARVHHLRLGDKYAAEALYVDALGQGSADGQTLRAAADAALELGHRGDAADLLRRRGASMALGAEQAENDVEAAILFWRGGRTADARALLERALLGDATDWRALSFLRDLSAETGDAAQLAAVQERMATLVPGAVAAEVWVDRARSAEAAGQHAEASLAWERAYAQRPGLVSAAGRLRMLQRAEDHAGVAEFARSVAPSRPFGWVVAADALLASGQPVEALAAFDEALGAGLTVVGPEADALRMQVDPAARRARYEASADSDALSALLLALLLEGEGQHVDAAARHRVARTLDPDCIPAWEGEARALRRSGDVAGERAHWQERIAAGWDESAARFHLAWLSTGEEGVAAWTALASEAGIVGHVAMRCLAASLLSSDRPERAAEAWIAEEATPTPAWLIACALAHPLRSDASAAWAQRALDMDPTFRPALDLLRAHWAGDPSRRASATLVASASAADEAAAALAWLAANDLVGTDPAAALDAARAAASVPGFGGAAALVRDQTTDPAEARAVWRAMAERQPSTQRWAWCTVASALVGGLGPDSVDDIERVRARDPRNAHATVLATWLAAGERDRAALAGALVDGSGVESSSLGERTFRAALLFAATGMHEAAEARIRSLCRMPPGHAPHGDAAWLAAAWGRHDLAADLLEAGVGDPADRGDLLDLYLARPLDAQSAYEAAGGRVEALLGRVRVASQRQDTASRMEALAALADDDTVGQPVRVSAAIGVAVAAAEASDVAAAGPAWDRVALLRPSSAHAFEGRLAAAIAARDGDRVRALFAASRPTDDAGLGEALERAGDRAGAAEVARRRFLRGDGLGEALPALLAAEILLAAIEDWAGVFDALTRRGEITCDESVAADIDHRRRWILREKLADSDDAWNLYRRLHDEAPEDREVTEALARIAAARGETALSIRYLSDLLRGNRDAAECARVQFRVGEAWRAAGNAGAARQAWLDALDHKPDHWDSLAALKALADAEGDKAGRIAVLRREAMLVEGTDRLDRLHAIARAEAEGADPAVALDAWRAVLDAVPDDEVALREAVALSEASGDTASLIAHGEALARALPMGAERAGWLRRVASLVLAQHDRDHACRLLEGAIEADPTDADSALRLEELYRSRGDQAALARVLEAATQHAVGPLRKDILLRRARFEIDARMDRETAARFYRGVLELDPKDETSLRFLSGHLYETGRFDEALAVFDALESIGGTAEPEDFDGRMEWTQNLYRHGDLLRRSGRVDEALARFERVLALNNGHIATLEAVGPIYVDRDDLAGAERTYRQLLQLSGGRGERAKIAGFYTQLGLVERRMGHVDKALKRFEKAIDVFPSYSPALKGLALVHEDRGDWSNALTVYNAIIGGAARSPDEVVDAYMTKGRLLDEKMSRPDKAQQHYERCLEYEGNQPTVYLRLAELAMRRDEYAQAGQLCETALHLADQDTVKRIRPLLLLGVAAGLSDGRNEGQACIAVDEALALDPAIAEALADPPLSDLEKLRLALRERLPGRTV